MVMPNGKQNNPVAAILVPIALEFVKLGMQTVLRAKAMANLTDEQIDAEWENQKTWFDAHPPEGLLDV